MVITLEAMDAMLEKNIESLSKIFDHITQLFKKILPAITIETIIDYGCSNVAKLFEKIYIFLRKNMYDFYKNFIFLSKNLFFFFQIRLCIQNKYLYLLSKKIILLKKNSLCKNIHSV